MLNIENLVTDSVEVCRWAACAEAARACANMAYAWDDMAVLPEMDGFPSKQERQDRKEEWQDRNPWDA